MKSMYLGHSNCPMIGFSGKSRASPSTVKTISGSFNVRAHSPLTNLEPYKIHRQLNAATQPLQSWPLILLAKLSRHGVVLLGIRSSPFLIPLMVQQTWLIPLGGIHLKIGQPRNMAFLLIMKITCGLVVTAAVTTLCSSSPPMANTCSRSGSGMKLAAATTLSASGDRLMSPSILRPTSYTSPTAMATAESSCSMQTPENTAGTGVPMEMCRMTRRPVARVIAASILAQPGSRGADIQRRPRLCGRSRRKQNPRI